MKSRLFPILIVSSIAIFFVVYLAVMPLRTWVVQKSQLEESKQENAHLQSEIEMLERRNSQLNTDEEIERVARQDYNFVYPDEESYRIVPSTTVVR